jgi:hypothetical protein
MHAKIVRRPTGDPSLSLVAFMPKMELIDPRGSGEIVSSALPTDEAGNTHRYHRDDGKEYDDVVL